MIVYLRVREETESADDYSSRLSKFRAQIDEYDGKILEILENRMKVADQKGLLKKEKNVAILLNNRWNEILGRMILEGESKGLSEEFVLKMVKGIHLESVSYQEKVNK